MRPRFRKRHGGDRADPGAPVEVAGPADGTEGAEPSGPTFDDLLALQLGAPVEPVEVEPVEVEPEPFVEVPVEPVEVEPEPFVEVPVEPVEVEPEPFVEVPVGPVEVEPVEAEQVDQQPPVEVEPAVEEGPDPAPVPLDDFWVRFDRATAEAELARVPPASVVAVVGPCEAAVPVVDRCREQHWMGGVPDVYVLTRRRDLDDRPGWTVVGRPSDLVAALEDGHSEFPVVVLDVPCDLPAFVRPLVGRLREAGVGLVHYVLDGDPDDEDLATWHGELGSPSVLHLAAPVAPARVLELLDRGEPVVSVAGLPLTAELLLAFRADHQGTAT